MNRAFREIKFGVVIFPVLLLIQWVGGCGTETPPLVVNESEAATPVVGTLVRGTTPTETSEPVAAAVEPSPPAATSSGKLLSDTQLAQITTPIESAIDELHNVASGSTYCRPTTCYQFAIDPSQDADQSTTLVILVGDVDGFQKSVYAAFIRDETVARVKHLRIGTLN